MQKKKKTPKEKLVVDIEESEAEPAETELDSEVLAALKIKRVKKAKITDVDYVAELEHEDLDDE